MKLSSFARIQYKSQVKSSQVKSQVKKFFILSKENVGATHKEQR